MPAPLQLPPILPDMPMGQVLQNYPGAQRALFARYHIGGCSSCGFSPTETLEQLCKRNEDIPVPEVIDHIQSSHDTDARLQLSPTEFEAIRTSSPTLKVLDVRTREEHEAVTIPGSQLMTQELIQEIFATWDKTAPLVLFDHTGNRCLDAVAYFIGHGFSQAKALTGGIDAYSAEVNSSIPRYRIELED